MNSSLPIEYYHFCSILYVERKYIYFRNYDSENSVYRCKYDLSEAEEIYPLPAYEYDGVYAKMLCETLLFYPNGKGEYYTYDFQSGELTKVSANYSGGASKSTR